MKKFLISCILLPFISINAIADENWIDTTYVDEYQYSIKAGSLEIIKNKRNEDIVVVIARVTNKKLKKIDLQKWYVTLEDCDRQQGKIVTLKLDGEFYFDNDFVISSGSVASLNAEFICGAYHFRVNENRQKGI